MAAGIKRVVAAMQDPNPKTAGQGFERLQNAGVEVVSGILEEEAQRLNEGFTYWIQNETSFRHAEIGADA